MQGSGDDDCRDQEDDDCRDQEDDECKDQEDDDCRDQEDYDCRDHYRIFLQMGCATNTLAFISDRAITQNCLKSFVQNVHVCVQACTHTVL